MSDSASADCHMAIGDIRLQSNVHRSTGYIDHSVDVASSIANLRGNDAFSDVTLVVQGVSFAAHRVILAARSEYFRALLYGGLAESSRSVIHLNDISATAFRFILQYIYTGRLNVRKLRTMLEVLGLAHQYNFHSLEMALSSHLTHSLRLSNVWLIYNLAVLYNLEDLINACLKFLDGIAPAPLHSPHFLRLSQTAVERLLSRDSFCASEIEIFRSLCAWFRATRVSKNNSQLSSLPGPTILFAECSSIEVSGTAVQEYSPQLNSRQKVLEERTSSLDRDLDISVAERRYTNKTRYCGSQRDEYEEEGVFEDFTDEDLEEKARRYHMICKCVRFELMSLKELLTEVRASKLVSSDDLLDAISRQAKSPTELPHRGWLLPGINLASHRFAASLIAGEEGSYPYFFVDDADDVNDLVELQYSFGALEAGYDMSNLELEELDEEAEVDEDEEEGHCDDETRGHGRISPESHPTAIIGSSQGEFSRSNVPITASGATEVAQGAECDTGRAFPSGSRKVNVVRFPANSLSSPHLTANAAGAQFSTANLPTSWTRTTNSYQRRSTENSQYMRISHQLDGTRATTVAFDNGSQPPAPLHALSGRAMRWLQPSNPRHRLTSHPPPPPHSEHDVVRHSLDDPDAHIVIRLGKPSIVNTIRMQLWDRELRCYSYYVEISLDQVTWQRVVDYRNCPCRSWQTLHFATRVIRYIRITGTRNTSNRTFHLTTFRCLYAEQVCRQVDGFLIPTYNVATVEHGATVLEGVSRNRNALIDGNARMYDWNSGYTCHQLGNGAIVVQLAQPFLLRSMRFLLWDLDDRTYSYSVHVSTNREDWRLVHDATRDRCQSWQLITFPLQLVTFIRVVGSYNSANEVFHMVHLECPYPPAELMEDQQNAAQSDPGAVNTARHNELLHARSDAASLQGGSESGSTSELPSYQATQATELRDSVSMLDPINDSVYPNDPETRPQSPPTPSDPPVDDEDSDRLILSVNSPTRSLGRIPTGSRFRGRTTYTGSETGYVFTEEQDTEDNRSRDSFIRHADSEVLLRRLSVGSSSNPNMGTTSVPSPLPTNLAVSQWNMHA
ncbi:unnamed protein product [Dicrocoelium dendriticum]|nr:unnamed protein product [Dicrocoelium dendriticum]